MTATYILASLGLAFAAAAALAAALREGGCCVYNVLSHPTVRNSDTFTTAIVERMFPFADARRAFLTGFTGLTGLSMALPQPPPTDNPVNLVNPVQNKNGKR